MLMTQLPRCRVNSYHPGDDVVIKVVSESYHVGDEARSYQYGDDHVVTVVSNQ
jgi:hypothetical protein